MPDCLAEQHGKYLVIPHVRFAYGHGQVLAALASNAEYKAYRRRHGEKAARNLAGNPDSPQAVIFLASITDVMMGSLSLFRIYRPVNWEFFRDLPTRFSGSLGHFGSHIGDHCRTLELRLQRWHTGRFPEWKYKRSFAVGRRGIANARLRWAPACREIPSPSTWRQPKRRASFGMGWLPPRSS